MKVWPTLLILKMMSNKPTQFDRNLIVIGAGSAGLVSSLIAAAVNAKVTLIEKHKMGGDCLNTGCVPSKALIKSAKIASLIKRSSDFGIQVPESNIDFSAVMERVQSIIKEIEPHDSVERFESLGVECIEGEAKITSPWSVEINQKTLTAKNIIIATGAGPLIPLITGIEKIDYLTSDSLWEIREQPKRLLVLGGGPIGCELSQAFARLGSSVTQVEMFPRIMAREDEDVSTLITNKFINEGIDVRTNHKAKEFINKNNKTILICEHDSQDVEIEFDTLLVAVGRKPNIKGFGLEELGIELNDNKTIKVNEYLQSSIPSIYACGDVAGPYQFTHTASHQAWFASVNSLFGRFKRFKADYSVIPWATFTDPEVARVGLNELEAKQQNISYETNTFKLDELDRALTDGETEGFIKVLTAPGKDKILGATIVGDHAGELITEYITAMKNKTGMNKILGTIHIYPTLSEANKYAAGIWKKTHAPKLVLKLIEKYHVWSLKH
jgi:dihydrolipoamide dehydrogenase